MSFFNKVSQGANRLFGKVLHDKNIFRKINNTVKTIDHNVNKVGNFITPVAKAFGYDGLIKSAMGASNRIANGLEKYVMPLHEARSKSYA